MSRTVEYHKGQYDPEVDLIVTPQEGYTQEEWDYYKHTCLACGDEFVLYFPDDTEARGQPAMYCSQECREKRGLEIKRAYAREWARRNRQAKKEQA